MLFQLRKAFDLFHIDQLFLLCRTTSAFMSIRHSKFKIPLLYLFYRHLI